MHPAISLDQPSQSPSLTLVKQTIGNATRETSLSFTFTVDKNKITGTQSLPFQVKISYKKIHQYTECSVIIISDVLVYLCRYKYGIGVKMVQNGYEFFHSLVK